MVRDMRYQGIPKQAISNVSAMSSSDNSRFRYTSPPPSPLQVFYYNGCWIDFLYDPEGYLAFTLFYFPLLTVYLVTCRVLDRLGDHRRWIYTDNQRTELTIISSQGRSSRDSQPRSNSQEGQRSGMLLLYISEQIIITFGRRLAGICIFLPQGSSTIACQWFEGKAICLNRLLLLRRGQCLAGDAIVLHSIEYCVPPRFVLRICSTKVCDTADVFAPLNRPVIFMGFSSRTSESALGSGPDG